MSKGLFSLGPRELRRVTASTTGWAMLDTAMWPLETYWRLELCLGWCWKDHVSERQHHQVCLLPVEPI